LGLLNKKRREPRAGRGVARLPQLQIGCGFCWEPLPTPEVQHDVFSGEGCLGGRCACGASFVIDETGREGGRTQLDLLALLSGGDLDRALALDVAREVELKRRDLAGGTGRHGRRMPAQGQLPPKIWFARLGAPGENEEGGGEGERALPGLRRRPRKRLRLNRRLRG
jgi:hypothetical protein